MAIFFTRCFFASCTVCRARRTNFLRLIFFFSEDFIISVSSPFFSITKRLSGILASKAIFTNPLGQFSFFANRNFHKFIMNQTNTADIIYSMTAFVIPLASFQIFNQLLDLDSLLLHRIPVTNGDGVIREVSKSIVTQYGVPISS